MVTYNYFPAPVGLELLIKVFGAVLSAQPVLLLNKTVTNNAYCHCIS